MLDAYEIRTMEYLNDLPTFEEYQKETNAMTDEVKNEKKSINSYYSNQKKNRETPNINKDNGYDEISLKNIIQEVIEIGEENKCKSDFKDTNSQSNLGIQEKCGSQKNTTSVNNSTQHTQHDDNSNLNSKSTKTKKCNENIKKKIPVIKTKNKGIKSKG